MGKIPVQTLSRRELDKIARTEFHQGIIAKVSPYQYEPLASVLDRGAVVLLDSVEDPQNTGSIIRTAYALSGRGDHHPRGPGRPDHAGRGQGRRPGLRARRRRPGEEPEERVQGAQEERLLDHRPRRPGEVSVTEVPAYDKVALLLGGEDSGIRYGLEKEADVMARIPMRGSFNSLNVSQSATIALYELVVRRAAPAR